MMSSIAFSAPMYPGITLALVGIVIACIFLIGSNK